MENTIALKGVQYIIASSGKRGAVLISLEEWGEICCWFPSRARMNRLSFGKR